MERHDAERLAKMLADEANKAGVGAGTWVGHVFVTGFGDYVAELNTGRMRGARLRMRSVSAGTDHGGTAYVCCLTATNDAHCVYHETESFPSAKEAIVAMSGWLEELRAHIFELGRLLGSEQVLEHPRWDGESGYIGYASTAHLSDADRLCMDRTADKHDGGWQYNLGDMDGSEAPPELSAPVRSILQDMKREGFWFVRFDQDAPELSNYEVANRITCPPLVLHVVQAATANNSAALLAAIARVSSQTKPTPSGMRCDQHLGHLEYQIGDLGADAGATYICSLLQDGMMLTPSFFLRGAVEGQEVVVPIEYQAANCDVAGIAAAIEAAKARLVAELQEQVKA